MMSMNENTRNKAVIDETLTLYIIRHGESVDDLEDRYGGIADFPLTEVGVQQALDLAKRLDGCNIEAIYSSPLQRAHSSAKIISDALGDVEIKVIDDMHERNTYGFLSGVEKDRAEKVFAFATKHLRSAEATEDGLLPGAESLAQLNHRVATVFVSIMKDASGAGYRSIAIVSHGKFIRSLLDNVLQLGDVPSLDHCGALTVEIAPFRPTYKGSI